MFLLPLLPRSRRRVGRETGQALQEEQEHTPNSCGEVGPVLVAVLSLLQVMSRDRKVVELGRVRSRGGVGG